MLMNKENSQNGKLSTLGLNILAVLVVIAIGAYLIGSFKSDREWNKRYEAYRDSAQVVATQYSDSVRLVVDSIVNVADSAIDKAEKSSKEIDRLTERNRRLSAQVENIVIAPITNLPPVCNVCVARLDTAIKQIEILKDLTFTQDSTITEANKRDSLRLVAIDNLKGALSIETHLTDSLKTVIINLPEPKKDKFFGLIHISNEAAFIAGTIFTWGLTRVVK